MNHLHVHLLPGHVEPATLAGSSVLVIDLLRASSTICRALASGAACVMPFREVAAALDAATKFPRSEIVLGGERHGKLIDGFDLGNSPLEYTAEAVAGKRLLFTTTNGTRALYHAAAAARTLIACALNRQAVATAVAGSPRVDILCAGTDGAVTGEDVLAAGAIAALLLATSSWRLNPGAKEAFSRWQALLAAAKAAGRTASEELALQMRDTPGGSNLIEIGHDRDLVACAELDALLTVPVLNRQTAKSASWPLRRHQYNPLAPPAEIHLAERDDRLESAGVEHSPSPD